MSKSLVTSLLLIAQNHYDRYKATQGLEGFFEEYGIGFKKGRDFILSDNDIGRIKMYLDNEHGIHWTTPVDAWNGISRNKALELGGNEKFTRKKVRDFRVAVKSLPGRPLLLGGESIQLPPGSNLDIEWGALIEQSGHDEILVIENWTNFEKTAKTPLLNDVPGNPLVLYRGDPIYGNQYAAALVKALKKPVTAFVDYDPAGLVIANSLPGLKKMLCPQEDKLHGLFQRLKTNVDNQERFIRQKSESIHCLAMLSNPQLKSLWKMFDGYGVALPQESLIVEY